MEYSLLSAAPKPAAVVLGCDEFTIPVLVGPGNGHIFKLLLLAETVNLLSSVG